MITNVYVPYVARHVNNKNDARPDGDNEYGIVQTQILVLEEVATWTI